MSIVAPPATLRQFLFEISPFRALPTAEMERLIAQAREKHFDRGDTIYSEGDPADEIWVVREGHVEILKYSCDGHAFAVETLGAGELFGTLCRLSSGEPTYPCSAVAESDCSVVEIPDRTFHELYARYPSVVAGVCMLCSQRLCTMQAFGCAAQEPVQRRMAGVLSQLYKTYGPTIPCTKRELSELAGTSIETTIRIVSGFCRKGWVESMRGKIVVKARGALEKLLKPLY